MEQVGHTSGVNVATELCLMLFYIDFSCVLCGCLGHSGTKTSFVVGKAEWGSCHAFPAIHFIAYNKGPDP
jgi:hypothetical protein